MKAQLDKAEREHLKDVVENLRRRVEDNVNFQLTQKGLDTGPEGRDGLEESKTRRSNRHGGHRWPHVD
jgi:hypothetical protein